MTQEIYPGRPSEHDPSMTAPRIAYGHGEHRYEAELAEGLYAAGCLEEKMLQVRKALEALEGGTVEEGPGVLFVRLPESLTDVLRDRILQQLGGDMRFFTQVLVDVQSRLQQILTDEIIVRFRTDVPTEEARRIAAAHGVVLEAESKYVANEYRARVLDPVELGPLLSADALDKDRAVDFSCPQFISEIRR